MVIIWTTYAIAMQQCFGKKQNFERYTEKDVPTMIHESNLHCCAAKEKAEQHKLHWPIKPSWNKKLPPISLKYHIRQLGVLLGQFISQEGLKAHCKHRTKFFFRK